MRFRLLVLVAMFLPCVGAYADTYEYAFTFSNISGARNVTSFTITFDEPSLITTTGVQSIPELTTPLGYTVNYVGANDLGDFIFDNVTPFITDNTIMYDSTSFSFSLAAFHEGYLGLGTYAGSVIGNAPDTFGGRASLTISDLPPSPPPSTATPEPSSLVLLGTGVLGFAGVVRRRLTRHS